MGSSWPGQCMQVQEELELRSCRFKKEVKKINVQVLQTLKCMDGVQRFNDSGTQRIWLPEMLFPCG